MGGASSFPVGFSPSQGLSCALLAVSCQGNSELNPMGWMDMEVSSLEVQEIVGKTEISFFVFKNTWKWGLF